MSKQAILCNCFGGTIAKRAIIYNRSNCSGNGKSKNAEDIGLRDVNGSDIDCMLILLILMMTISSRTWACESGFSRMNTKKQPKNKYVKYRIK